LGWENEITEYLAPEVSLPAIGQGALGIEGRREDGFVREVLGRLEHEPTRAVVTAERALLHRLQGGCQVPIAAHATLIGSNIVIEGLVASVDGKKVIRDRVTGAAHDPCSIGVQLAERLLARGGDRILQAIYGTAP
jgi:hydroxymethylbilane synthase